MTCAMEMCRNWTGHGCVCEVLDLDPDVVEESPKPPADTSWIQMGEGT